MRGVKSNNRLQSTHSFPRVVGEGPLPVEPMDESRQRPGPCRCPGNHQAGTRGRRRARSQCRGCGRWRSPRCRGSGGAAAQCRSQPRQPCRSSRPAAHHQPRGKSRPRRSRPQPPGSVKSPPRQSGFPDRSRVPETAVTGRPVTICTASIMCVPTLPRRPEVHWSEAEVSVPSAPAAMRSRSPPIAGVKAQIVIDDEQGISLVAGRQHARGLGDCGRNGLFAVDGAGTGFYGRLGDLGGGRGCT